MALNIPTFAETMRVANNRMKAQQMGIAPGAITDEDWAAVDARARKENAQTASQQPPAQPAGGLQYPSQLPADIRDPAFRAGGSPQVAQGYAAAGTSRPATNAVGGATWAGNVVAPAPAGNPRAGQPMLYRGTGGSFGAVNKHEPAKIRGVGAGRDNAGGPQPPLQLPVDPDEDLEGFTQRQMHMAGPMQDGIYTGGPYAGLTQGQAYEKAAALGRARGLKRAGAQPTPKPGLTPPAGPHLMPGETADDMD